MSDKKNFRVIIAGGGIAGLTLANCLEKAKIDYVLLEARHEIAPQVGASIGMMPNGSRILDQLGCFDDLEKGLETIRYAADRDATGELLHPAFDGFQLASTRSGYAAAFGDRQNVLEVLYKNIMDKSKILLGKRLERVDEDAQRVKVFCTDGTSYEGDVLAGADGVYSKVRNEMWRLADAVQPGLIAPEEKQRMSAEYKCMFGICNPIPGYSMMGYINVNYMKDVVVMVIGSKSNGFYVFVIAKLDKRYWAPNIPRFTEQDAIDFGFKHAAVRVLPDLTFGRMWEGRRSQKLVALEEADFRTWSFGRIACLGDSIHKMTPDAGQGGNSSVESAAALSNALKTLVDASNGKPSREAVAASLKQYQANRDRRISSIIKSCNELTRIHSLSNWFNTLFVYQLSHRLGDALMDFQAEMMIGAEKLDFLPVPRRSLECNMPFNPQQGEGYKESRLKRAIIGLPFVGLLIFACYYAMDPTVSFQYAAERLQAGTVTWASGSVPIRKKFYDIGWLDEIWSPVVLYFTSLLYGYDPETRWQAISFLFDLGPLIAILYLESTRRSNAITFAQVPILITLIAQLRGIGAVIPIYYYLHYIFTPVSSFKATDMRLTNVSYSSAILPSLIVLYYIPSVFQFFHPSLEARQSWNWFWQMYPVWVSIAAWVGQKLRKDTMNYDRLYAPTRDLTVLRYTVGVTVAISAVTWWCTLALSPFSPKQLFIPNRFSSDTGNLDEFMNVMLKWDELLMFVNSFLWLGYCFWDMKVAGMMKVKWTTILAAGALSLAALGPGATLGLGWLWREQGITFGRHRAAITYESLTTEKGRRDSGIGGPDEKMAYGKADGADVVENAH